MLYYFALKIAGMFMSVFGTNYTVFVLGRFCMGCGHVGYHHPGFVLGNTFFANVTIHLFIPLWYDYLKLKTAAAIFL